MAAATVTDLDYAATRDRPDRGRSRAASCRPVSPSSSRTSLTPADIKASRTLTASTVNSPCCSSPASTASWSTPSLRAAATRCAYRSQSAQWARPSRPSMKYASSPPSAVWLLRLLRFHRLLASRGSRGDDHRGRADRSAAPPPSRPQTSGASSNASTARGDVQGSAARPETAPCGHASRPEQRRTHPAL